MKKQLLFKLAKSFFLIAGFPAMLVMMLATLAPMFGEEVMGDAATVWIVVFFVLWAVFEASRFLIMKFVGKKSETHRNVAVIATAVIAVILVLVPCAIGDAVVGAKYEKDYDALAYATDVRSYDSLKGWHRGFTGGGAGEMDALIDAHYDFMKQYGISGTESSWYGDADKENNLGYKYGSFEKLDVLYAEKLAAVDKLAAAEAELAAIEARQAELQAAYDAAADDETKAAALAALNEYNASVDADLIRLQGARLDISSVKTQLCEVLATIANDLLKGEDGTILSGTWKIELLGQTIDIKGILQSILDKIPVSVDGIVTADMLAGIIPDVISTGLGPETISTYETAVNGGGLLSDEMSLAEVESLRFRVNHYPDALAMAATEYAAFVFVGVIVLSVFLADFFARKEEREAAAAEEGGKDNE